MDKQLQKDADQLIVEIDAVGLRIGSQVVKNLVSTISELEAKTKELGAMKVPCSECGGGGMVVYHNKDESRTYRICPHCTGCG